MLKKIQISVDYQADKCLKFRNIRGFFEQQASQHAYCCGLTSDSLIQCKPPAGFLFII